MKQYLMFLDEFKKVYKDENIKVNEKMSEHISFKVGGPADILLQPVEVDQVVKAIDICKQNNIPFIVIGNGSNLLVKDGGIRGVVIELSNINKIEINSGKIKAYCGALLKDVSDVALNNSLTGFEFACGIPGSVGGAVFMNAGAYDGEIKNVIESADVLDKQGNVITLSKDELGLGYRTSKVMKEGLIVISATFALENGDKQKIYDRIEDLNNRRQEKQPLEYPSAGSTFKRPEGYFAGKLIQDAGLKGFELGGAAVSAKHSGFVINKNNATAKEILDLIKYVQNEVKEKFGVDLYPEVRILGEDL